MKETENYFQNQENHSEINFWIVNVSDDNSPTKFLFDWLKDKSDLFNWIGTGNPSVIWLSSGETLNYEFSAYVLRTEGVIEQTKKIFKL